MFDCLVAQGINVRPVCFTATATVWGTPDEMLRAHVYALSCRNDSVAGATDGVDNCELTIFDDAERDHAKLAIIPPLISSN